MCAEFDLFLCELAKDPGRRDDFNDGLLFLRLWQRLRLQKIWKYEGLAKEIIKKYASLRPNFDVFFKVTTPILELIKIASQMTSEMEHRREASAFVLDTMRAAMKVPNYLTLPNPCASLEFFINNIDTQDIAPASFIALLDVLKSHNLEICQQVDWDKWVTLFIRLIPYGPILPHEPYQSRFIRWQSHNVIPRRKALYIKEGLRVRGKDIIRLLNRENLFAYCNLLAEPIEISYKERPTAINTIVELCEWLLRNIPSVPPWVFLNRKITNAIFKATIYKFTLTGQWGSNYFDHLIVKLWCSTINSKEWLDSKRLIERRLALKLTKPKVREAIGTILELEDKWFVEHFHHTDEIFHLK